MVLWWSSFVGVITSQPDQHCLYLGTLKTCIAITSLRTTSTSRDWACKLLTSSPCLFADIRSVVYGIFSLETVQTILSGVALFYLFADVFCKFKHLNSPV